MRIYCMSDIHGCLAEFDAALEKVVLHLKEENTMLLLLGDYIHGGPDGRGVMDRIMKLQSVFGSEKVVALIGNHDEWFLDGTSTIDYMQKEDDPNLMEGDEADGKYEVWLGLLQNYYVEGNTIFVHAGIDETAGDMWEWETDDSVFTSKYPPEIGKIEGLSMKVVAGHVGTATIADNPKFHDIFFDGESHYYIDGTVLDSGYIPVLLVDTDADMYYQVTEDGEYLIEKYE